MPLDAQDSSQLNYKANIRYYQKRVADLQSGFVNPAALAQAGVNPDNYIQNLNDIGFKANNLIARIVSESSGLTIPVNPITEPTVSAAALALDSSSNGEYISFETYNTALQQINAGVANLDVENLIANTSNNDTTNSQLVQSSIYAGYASFSGNPVSATSTYEDTIQTWGGTDSNIQTVVSFANNFLSTFPSVEYTPWAFASNVYAEQTNINSATNLWNSFSPTGVQGINTLGGSLQSLPPLTPDPNITAATDKYLNYANQSLENINNLLNNTWGGGELVCLVNFFAGRQIAEILALISLLEMLKFNVNFDFKDLLSAFESVLTNMMRNLIINQLLNILLQIDQRVVQPVENWINTEVNQIQELASICPLFSKFVNQNIVGAVATAENQINGIIIELMKSLELKKIQDDAKISQALTNNFISQSITTMNMLVTLMRQIQNAPNLLSVDQNISGQVVGQFPIQSPYIYPQASSPNSYNTFATVQAPDTSTPNNSLIPLNMPGPISF